MRGLLRLLLGVALLLLPASNAHACNCSRPGRVCSIAMGSSTIFRGTVVEITAIPDIRTVKLPDGTETQFHGGGTFKVRLSVAETFSGSPRAEQIVYTAQQSSSCGFRFEVGREYVVLAYQKEAQLWTTKCSRTALLEPGVANPDLAWMRSYKTAPHGSEIYGLVQLQDESAKGIPATIQLSGTENRTVTADAEGKYSIRNLTPGEYLVTALVPDGLATTAPTKITVADKGCAEVYWPVTYEGRIQGNVVDVEGKPVADLQMELEISDENRMQFQQTATTDLKGSYAFEHLSPGSYFVSARNADFLTGEETPIIYYPHSPRQEARSVLLGPAATLERVDFVLARLRFIPPVRVNVVLPDGSPVPAGFYLSAFPNGTSGNEPARSGLTDNSGTALLPLSLGREYAISVALDAQHPSCGFATLTFSKAKMAGTVVIEHPEVCPK